MWYHKRRTRAAPLTEGVCRAAVLRFFLPAERLPPGAEQVTENKKEKIFMEVHLGERGGALKMYINGEEFEPLSFKSFRPNEQNIGEFYAAGVRLFSILSSGLYSILGVPYSLFGESWVGEGRYDFAPIDRQIELFLSRAPEGYFALMVQLDTRPWYLAARKGCPDSFTCLSQVANDAAWRAAAGDYLEAVITHVEGRYGERFYGYFMLGGTTTEWFSHRDYAEAHPYKTAAFRRYLGDETAEIPDKAEREHCTHGSFRDGVADGRALAYWRFHHHSIADTILYFAARAQHVLHHRKLLGVYFGYLLELNGERLWNDGHLAYEDVFFSPDIDMISSPSSYEHRNVSGESAFMVPYDSLKLHKKLYYLEFDHITHVAPPDIEGYAIPGYASQFQTEEETLEVMRRDYMLCLAKGAALWWFDMFDGWFRTARMMEEIGRMTALSRTLAGKDMSGVSEVAVFAEGESLYYVSKDEDLNTTLLGKQRRGLARMGAPYDLFSMGDFERVAHEKYKLYIFPDAFRLSPERRAAILTCCRAAGKSALFQFAPDYVQGDGVSVAAASRMAGMTLSPCTPGAAPLTVDFFAEDGGAVRVTYKKTPATLFAVTDPEAEPLATYPDGSVAMAHCRQGDAHAFFSATGDLPPEALRRVCRMAGVHLYSEANDVVVANRSLIGVYTAKDGETRLHVPQDGVYTDRFSGISYTAQDGWLCIPAPKNHAILLLREER